MSIAILCPTRGRPEQCLRMMESIGATAYSLHNVNVYSASNGGDEYADVKYPVDCPTVFMWNSLAQHAMLDSSNDLFMLGADDTVFATPMWDKILMEANDAVSGRPHIYAFRDSRDPLGTPHPIVNRAYIEAMGFFLPPIFMHWYCDTWTVAIAKANNVFTHLTDIELTHIKPSDHGQADETHARIRRNGWHARDKAVNDACQHFLELEKQRLATIIGERL